MALSINYCLYIITPFSYSALTLGSNMAGRSKLHVALKTVKIATDEGAQTAAKSSEDSYL